MQKSDTVSGLAFAAVGVFFIIGAFSLGISSPTKDGVPGAGFFPFIMGLSVAFLGGLLMLKSLMYKGEKEASFALDAEQRANLRPFFATIGSLAALFAVWHILNFEAAAVLFGLVINRLYGRSWRFGFLFSLVFVGLIYLMFVKLFHIQFEL